MKKLLSILFPLTGPGCRHGACIAGSAGFRQGLHRAAHAATYGRAGRKDRSHRFFWYGCPHCNEFNPYLEAWVKKQGPDVVFKRVPVAFRDDFIPHSKMYHALDALGLATQLTPKVFNEIHVNKDYLLTPEDQAKFLAKNGVDPKKYMDAYNSFSTQSALQKDKKLMDDYKIDGVPTLAVQGKYETGPLRPTACRARFRFSTIWCSRSAPRRCKGGRLPLAPGVGAPRGRRRLMRASNGVTTAAAKTRTKTKTRTPRKACSSPADRIRHRHAARRRTAIRSRRTASRRNCRPGY